MENVYVHPRISERHPEIVEADVLAAWRNCLKSVPRFDRDPREHIAIGADARGRLLEMIAVVERDGTVIFHTFTPPTRKALRKLGF